MEQYRTLNQLLLDCELKRQTLMMGSYVKNEKTKFIQVVESLFEKTMGFSVTALEPNNQFLLFPKETNSTEFNPAI
jgi:hypothetical protein